MPKHIHWYKNKEKARVYRNRQRKKNYDSGGYVGQDKTKWTKKEVEILINFKGTYRELAQILKRSMSGITKKKCLLKNKGVL